MPNFSSQFSVFWSVLWLMLEVVLCGVADTMGFESLFHLGNALLQLELLAGWSNAIDSPQCLQWWKEMVLPVALLKLGLLVLNFLGKDFPLVIPNTN